MALLTPSDRRLPAPVRWALVGVGALGLAVAALRSAGFAFLAQGGACLPVLATCDGGAAALFAAETRLGSSPRAQPRNAALAAAALPDLPASGRPFAWAGLVHAAAGDDRTATALMTRAAARDPRSVSARAYQLDAALRQGDYQRVVALGDRLYAIDPALGPGIAQLFAGVAGMPAGRAALKEAIARGPAWRGALFAALGTGRADPAITFGLLDRASAGDSSATATQQEAFLNALMDRGDYQRAYLGWINFLPAGAYRWVAYLYDGDFARRPGPRPFNWTLLTGEEGAVDITGGQLRVAYFGQAPQRLAQQALVLEPGRYRLTVRGTASDGDAAAQLLWSLRCYPAQAPVGQLTLAGFGAAPRTAAAAFTIAAGCPAQLLTLDGVPGDVTQQSDVAIDAVRIERVAA